MVLLKIIRLGCLFATEEVSKMAVMAVNKLMSALVMAILTATSTPMVVLVVMVAVVDTERLQMKNIK